MVVHWVGTGVRVYVGSPEGSPLGCPLGYDVGETVVLAATDVIVL